MTFHLDEPEVLPQRFAAVACFERLAFQARVIAGANLSNAAVLLVAAPKFPAKHWRGLRFLLTIVFMIVKSIHPTGSPLPSCVLNRNR
jgi:hypothetical protein